MTPSENRSRARGKRTAIGIVRRLRTAGHRLDVVLLALLLVAFLLRAFVATRAPLVFDEYGISIPVAMSISFDPGTLHLPIRGPHHPALPSYVVKASGELFGTSPVGYRMLHLAIGALTMLVVVGVTADWFGTIPARWAAALLAFNEYHIGVSAYATAKGPHLLFVALAIYTFGRFLLGNRSAFLYAAGVASALAFYCKEHSALLLAGFFLTLCHPAYRSRLRSPHAYLAFAVFIMMIVPDIRWNVAADVTGVQVTYRDHLDRIAGLGFTPHYLLFFARDAIQYVHTLTLGGLIPDDVAPNPSMNFLVGIVMVGAVMVKTLGYVKVQQRSAFFLLLFWLVLGFFLLIRPGQPAKALDPIAWYWVDMTLFPAIVVSGSVLSAAKGRWGAAARTTVVIGILYAMIQITTLWMISPRNNWLDPERVMPLRSSRPLSLVRSEVSFGLSRDERSWSLCFDA